jgi:hypothetical protein
MESRAFGWFAFGILALAVALAVATAGMVPPGNGELARVAVAAAPNTMVAPDSSVAPPRTGAALTNVGSWRSVFPGSHRLRETRRNSERLSGEPGLRRDYLLRSAAAVHVHRGSGGGTAVTPDFS